MARSHIAILKRPYLDLILTGEKTMECRLTRTARAPFKRIAPGEVVLLKESAGPVRGCAVVSKVKFCELSTAADVAAVKARYNSRIMGADDFWAQRSTCRYCTLIWFKAVRRVEPYRIATRGMRAWITCDEAT